MWWYPVSAGLALILFWELIQRFPTELQSLETTSLPWGLSLPETLTLKRSMLAILLEHHDEEFYAVHLSMEEKGVFPEPDEVYSQMSIAGLAVEGLDAVGIRPEHLERSRSAVSHAIRTVLKRLEGEQGHPSLRDHLRASLSTGTKLSYRPAVPTKWNIRK